MSQPTIETEPRSYKSISRHFHRALIKVVLSVMTVFTLFIIIFNAVRMDRELGGRLEKMMGFSEVIAGSAVWHLHYEYLEQCVDSLLVQDMIVYAGIIDQSGEVLVRKVKDGTEPPPFDTYADSYRYMAKQAPILYSGTRIGTIQLAVTREGIFKDLVVDTIWSLSAMICLFISIIMTIIVISRRHIINPVLKLKDSAALIAGGNLDAYVDTSGTDEIGELAGDLDTMRESIKKLFDDLKEANIHLGEYTETLEQKVADRTVELRASLEEVEEANRIIYKSIRYAQRIQRSLLPATDPVGRHLGEHFIFWQPCDIVGGDIYLFEAFPDGYLIGVFDCTGHGVPGAFMTMIAGTVFKRAVSGDLRRSPSGILKMLNREVYNALYAKGEASAADDGLDAAVCFFDNRNRTITFSGAKLPFIHVDETGIHKINGDRQSIGYKNADIGHDFAEHSIPIRNKTAVYLFTDGITGQTGGPKRISLGRKRFMAELHSVWEEPFDKQCHEIIRLLNDWRGNRELEDDVTVIGIGFSA